MSRSWDDIEREASKGPQEAWNVTKPVWPKVLGVIMLLMVVGTGLSIFGSFLGLFSGTVAETAAVAREEFGPRALLRKYEWFKDAAAQLDKKGADIKVYQTKVDGMKEEYADTPRKDWDRVDKQMMSQWMAELAGTIASYNGLAAEYNGQMAKFNYRFTNVGDLPAGATEPLPREFREYKTQ